MFSRTWMYESNIVQLCDMFALCEKGWVNSFDVWRWQTESSITDQNGALRLGGSKIKLDDEKNCNEKLDRCKDLFPIEAQSATWGIYIVPESDALETTRTTALSGRILDSLEFNSEFTWYFSILYQFNNLRCRCMISFSTQYSSCFLKARWRHSLMIY